MLTPRIILNHFREILSLGVELIRGELPRFTADRRANVAIIFALTSIPIMFAIGMAVDYTSAARRKTMLNAAADAAALAAVTPTEFSQQVGQGPTASQAQQTATNVFNALSGTVAGVTSIAPTITVTDVPTGSSVSRTAVVSYTAQSTDAFGGIIGKASLTISGNSTANAAAAPNINFYVLADSSPSMAIPATTAGINQMYSVTSTGSGGGGDNENGCSFACHETDQTKWVLPGNSTCPGTGTSRRPGNVDDYTYAECVLGLTLRIDNLRSAISNLGTYSQTISSKNAAQYQMALSTFDTNWTTGCGSQSPLHTIVSTPEAMLTASASASNISMLPAYNNTYYYVNPNNSNIKCNNDDGDTDINDALSQINSAMPTPGNGSNAKGDTPQEVLFLITDGVSDTYSPRTVALMDTTKCDAIKQRVSSAGLPIRIAVIYLNYLPIPTNSFYEQNVAPFQSQIGPALQSCASSPSLYAEVSTDQDISAALDALFLNVTATAHLTK